MEGQIAVNSESSWLFIAQWHFIVYSRNNYTSTITSLETIYLDLFNWFGFNIDSIMQSRVQFASVFSSLMLAVQVSLHVFKSELSRRPFILVHLRIHRVSCCYGVFLEFSAIIRICNPRHIFWNFLQLISGNRAALKTNTKAESYSPLLIFSFLLIVKTKLLIFLI